MIPPPFAADRDRHRLFSAPDTRRAAQERPREECERGRLYCRRQRRLFQVHFRMCHLQSTEREGGGDCFCTLFFCCFTVCLILLGQLKIWHMVELPKQSERNIILDLTALRPLPPVQGFFYYTIYKSYKNPPTRKIN